MIWLAQQNVKREGADQAETEKKIECKITPTNNKNQTQWLALMTPQSLHHLLYLSKWQSLPQNCRPKNIPIQNSASGVSVAALWKQQENPSHYLASNLNPHKSQGPCLHLYWETTSSPVYWISVASPEASGEDLVIIILGWNPTP